MNLIINKKYIATEYESDILEYIRENPSGITITEIAKEKGYSRNTVSKYVSLLELKKKIFRRKVGAYNLFFSVKKSFFPKEIITSYYKALLSGLKKNYPNDEKIFKLIGRNSLEFIDFAFSPSVKKGLKSLKELNVPKLYFEVFGKFYSSYDILQPSIEISDPIIDKSGKQAVYRFKNSEFLEDSEDFIYHFYLVSGIIEALWTRELGNPVECNIENVHIANRKADSSIDLSIKIL